MHLKEWLAVVAAAKAPKNLFEARNVQLAIASLLTDQDPDIQQAALKCLKVCHESFLLGDEVSAQTEFSMSGSRKSCSTRAIICGGKWQGAILAS